MVDFMVKVFFRNDDVYKPDKKFSLVNKIFIREKIPLHHSIIPKKLTEDSSMKLIKLKRENERLMEFGQHGYSHKKYEFGNNLGYAIQSKRIERGKKIMENLIGEHFVQAFAPPFHSFNTGTLRAVEDNGFNIFSSDIKSGASIKNYKFSFAPTPISLNIPFKKILPSVRVNGQETVFYSSLVHLQKEFIYYKERLPVLGVSLHHEMCSLRDLKNLIIFLRYLKKTRDVKICRLSEVDRNEGMPDCQ